jgi:triacylglycerol lipase
MLAPAAHHASLTRSVDVLVRLSRAGWPGLMAEDCVAGACAQESFEESRQPVPDGVAFTAIYSRRDGIVDWRACVDPLATGVEVTASHVGMAVDPETVEQVGAALLRHRDGAAGAALVVEVDRGESA